MNVLFLAADFYPNSTGFANATFNLVESINEFGRGKYNLFVFTCALKNELMDETDIATIIRYKENRLNNRYTRWMHELIKYKYIVKVIEKNDIDIIFLETNTFPFVQNLLLKHYREKMIVRIHSTLDTEIPIFTKPSKLYLKLDYLLMKSFMKKVKYVVSTSDYYLNFIKNHYLENNVLEIWIDKVYGIIHNTTENIDKLSYNHKSNVYLSLGKMSEYGVVQKGMYDLIKAVYILKKNDKIPDDFKLKIVGNGEFFKYLFSYCKKLGLENEIDFLGNVNHIAVYELFKEAKAVILLSRFEGQSMFVTEALANGMPLIITSENGMEHMVIDDSNGKHVKTGDPYDAAKALEYFFELNQEKLIEMSNNSRNLFLKCFSRESVYKEFDEFLSMII